MAGLYFKVGSDYENVIRLRTEIEKLKSTLSGMDGNTPPATLRAMEVQLAKNTKELDTMVSAAAKAGNELDQNFKKKIFLIRKKRLMNIQYLYVVYQNITKHCLKALRTLR